MQVFPSILEAYMRIFEIIQLSLVRQWVANPARFTLAQRECVAVIDRLANYAITGDSRVFVTSIFRHLGILASLRRHHWPFIDPRIVDLRKPEIDTCRWPRVTQSDELQLAHLRAVLIHYGSGIRDLVYRQILMDDCHIKIYLHHDDGSIVSWLVNFFNNIYTHDMQSRIGRIVQDRLHGHLKPLLTVLRTEDNLRRATQVFNRLDWWRSHKAPFTRESYIHVCRLYEINCNSLSSYTDEPAVISTDEHVVTSADYLSSLIKYLQSLVNREESAAPFNVPGTRYHPKNSAWPQILAQMVQHVQDHVSVAADFMPQMIKLLSQALAQSSVKIFPGGVNNSRFLPRSFVSLVSSDLAATTVTAPAFSPASLAPSEWMCRSPLFPKIPQCVLQGFEKHYNNCISNPSIQPHYQITHNILKEHLETPACQLALLLTVTLINCNVKLIASDIQDNLTRPESIRWHVRSGVAKSQSMEWWAVILLTKMFWFAFPKLYPYNDKKSSVDGQITVFGIKKMLTKLSVSSLSLSLYFIYYYFFFRFVI